MEPWEAVRRATEAASEYWKLATSTGFLAVGTAAAAWSYRRMVGRTARKIYAHMVAENASVRRRLGRGQQIIEDALGFSTRNQNAHKCAPSCARRNVRLSWIDRLFVNAAFGRLLKDPRVVFVDEIYYIKGTEPK